jgi:DNA-binding transcriptional LysR family regulator
MINIDFKMAVFFAAVKHLSFTKAAQELNISQPAVSKSIHEFEILAGKSLFERNGNRLMVTEAGQLIYKYAQELNTVYEQINEGLDMLDGKISGDLRLGASTTLSNYIVPNILADFHAAYPATQIKVLHGNSQQVEQWLAEKTIDLGILEGLSNNSSLKYEAFLKDELVLVARQSNSKIKGRDFIKPKELLDLEFVIREQGSGTNDVLRKALLQIGVNWHDLDIKVILASTESIKNFLLHSDCVAYLSIYSIMKELKSGDLKVVDIEGFEVKRDFFFVHPQGVINRLPEVFFKFAKKKFSDPSFS